MESCLPASEKETACFTAYAECSHAHGAAVGGFMGRKGDGQPGAKAVLSGMQARYFFVEGMRVAIEMAAGKSHG